MLKGRSVFYLSHPATKRYGRIWACRQTTNAALFDQMVDSGWQYGFIDLLVFIRGRDHQRCESADAEIWTDTVGAGG
jgi:hypothetical protein